VHPVAHGLTRALKRVAALLGVALALFAVLVVAEVLGAEAVVDIVATLLTLVLRTVRRTRAPEPRP